MSDLEAETQRQFFRKICVIETIFKKIVVQKITGKGTDIVFRPVLNI